jgi:hypothetical protein
MMVKRTAAGTVLGGSLLFTAGLGIASAAPAGDISDGLVNLGVGNNSSFLTNVDAGVAAKVASLICGNNATDIDAQVNQVDAGTSANTTCDSAQGIVTISQNGPASSPNPETGPVNAPNAPTAPGQQGSAHAGSAEAPAQSPAQMPEPATPVS